MSKALRILLASLTVLVLLVAVVVIAVAWFDWNRAKPWLAGTLSDVSGREFVIDGDLTAAWRPPPEAQGLWRFLPWPHFRAHGVGLGNTDWADSGRWMGRAPAVDFSLNLPQLLRRRIVVNELRLVEPVLVAERAPDGRRNWQFTPRVRDQPQGEPWQFVLKELSIAGGRLRYVEPGKGTDLALRVDTARNGSVRWSARGRYNAEALRASGSAGALLSLRRSDTRYPVEAEIRMGDTHVSARGTITDPARPTEVDLRLQIAGASMADLYPLSGLLLPKTPRFSTTGRVVGRIVPGAIDLRYEGFTGKAGGSDIAGTLRYRQQSPRPLLVGEVVSQQLRLADLGRMVSVGPPDAASRHASELRQPAGRVLPVSPFKTERWHRMDVQVRFTGKKIIRRADLPIEDLDTRIAMQAGVLSLDPLRFGMAGGRLSGAVRIDGLADTAQGRLRLQAQGLQLARLFPKVGNGPASVGRLAARAELRGEGNSVAALLGSASGEMSAVISEGSVSKFVLEAAGLNLASAAIAKVFGDRQVPIQCVVADLALADGIARPRAFVLDTPDASITATGAINLKGERYDLTLHPRSKGLRILSLRSPLYIRGSFAQPEVGLDKRAVALKAGAATVLGALAAPVAGLLALVSPGRDAPSPCARLLAQLPPAPAR